MTVPFISYLDIKDNYCLGYFGNDKDIISKMLVARDCIESELQGFNVFISCKDSLNVDGKNIIPESRMADYKGKMGHFCNLEKLQDLKSLLVDAKIPIPEDF
jgi:hypothetical protein